MEVIVLGMGIRSSFGQWEIKGKGFLAFEKEEKRWSLFSLEFVLSDVAPVTAVAIPGYWAEGDVLT